MMKLNEVENLKDLIFKIYKYKFIPLFLIIIIPISAYLWETNKKIIENYKLTIQPISLIEFEKNFPEFSFNFNQKTQQNIKKNYDSLYSLHYSPLSFLNSFKEELITTISSKNEKLINFEDLKSTTRIIMDNSTNQHSLQIYILKLKENQNVIIFLENLLSIANENLRENFNIAVKQQIKTTSKKIDILSTNPLDQLGEISELKSKMLNLKSLLNKSSNIEFVSININTIQITDNKISNSKIIMLSIFVGFIISIGLVLFLPNKN